MVTPTTKGILVTAAVAVIMCIQLGIDYPREGFVLEWWPRTPGVAFLLLVFAATLGDGPPRVEYTYWYEHTSILGGQHVVATTLFLATAAVPIGVVLGRLAVIVTRGRLPALAAAAALGTLWVAHAAAAYG